MRISEHSGDRLGASADRERDRVLASAICVATAIVRVVENIPHQVRDFRILVHGESVAGEITGVCGL